MIYKYDLDTELNKEKGFYQAKLTIPFAARFLDVQQQHSQFGVGMKGWFHVLPTHVNSIHDFTFSFVPTGMDPDDSWNNYKKTMQLENGIILHVYIEEEIRLKDKQ